MGGAIRADGGHGTSAHIDDVPRGGGGGGSGGTIFLEAQCIDARGSISAAGGNGGLGSNSNSVTDPHNTGRGGGPDDVGLNGMDDDCWIDEGGDAPVNIGSGGGGGAGQVRFFLVGGELDVDNETIDPDADWELCDLQLNCS